MAISSAARPWTRTHPASRFARFVEKPDAATAARYLESGDYYWNSGMFAVPAPSLPRRTGTAGAGIARPLPRRASRRQSGSRFLPPRRRRRFEACKSISIDYAVMEHTAKAALVPVEMGWSDIGSWEALWDARRPRTRAAMPSRAMFCIMDARNSYLRSEGPMVAAVGVEDLVVVATTDAVLVSRKDMLAGRQEDRRATGKRRPRTACHPPEGLSGPGALMRAWTRAKTSRSSTSPSIPAPNCRCRCTISAPSIGWWCRAPRR